VLRYSYVIWAASVDERLLCSPHLAFIWFSLYVIHLANKSSSSYICNFCLLAYYSH